MWHVNNDFFFETHGKGADAGGKDDVGGREWTSAYLRDILRYFRPVLTRKNLCLYATAIMYKQKKNPTLFYVQRVAKR